MKKKIAILGSTGSIGKSLLKILAKKKKNFEIVLLSTNRNYKILIKQIEKFKVKNVIIKDSDALNKFKKLNISKKVKVFNNFENLHQILKKKIDYTMSAIVGLDGLGPTLKIIKHTYVIAIANKESIICGWSLIKKNLNKYKTNFVPVDSEHFSAWFALNENNNKLIKKLFLTASGGPFLNLPIEKFKNIRVKDAIKHPNWKMGKKISIDSSTMINKVFEIIEAKKIFNIEYHQISILIHPKSYVHAIIEFKNGFIKVIAHNTNMMIPIFNSIYDSKKELNFQNKKIDINKLNNLQFQNVDETKYPLVKILKILPKKNSLFETALVSANDELVRQFLTKKIQFKDISKILLKFLKNKKIAKLKDVTPTNIKQIVKINNYVRLKIRLKDI